MKIGFIGTGVMGKGMIRNLLKNEYEVHIYNRTQDKALPLVEDGAILEKTIPELVKKCNVVITIVGYPKDVEEVYLGEEGIIKSAKENSILIDMTTSKPSLAETIYVEAKKNNISALDAPVSGGDIGARDGKLTIMVGGEKEAYDRVLPVFKAMGENIVYQGEAGNGQHTKMCNQIAIASGMLGVSEAVAYASKSGLDPETVLKSIGFGAAGSWSLTNLAPRMIKEDLEPGFYIKHFLKDLAIAIEEAERMDLKHPGLKNAQEIYMKLIDIDQIYNDKGTQAIIKYYL